MVDERISRHYYNKGISGSFIPIKVENMDTTPYAHLERFQQQRHLLITCCERLLAVLAALESRALQDEAQQLLQTLSADKLQVLVVGKGNRGKSTVINALLGQKVLP